MGDDPGDAAGGTRFREIGRAGRPVVVLGSASPARRSLLQAAGIDPVVLASGIDEDALVAAAGAGAEDARWLTAHLAQAKASDVAATVVRSGLPGTGTGDRPVLVVAADSLLAFGAQVLGKARSAQAVRDRWARMSGQVGELVTTQVVVDVAADRRVAATVGTTILFGRPDQVELEAYIASGEPMAVAGSCTIDGLGGAFIDAIDGDHGNVIGLSLPTLRTLVASLGWRWTDLWTHGAGTGWTPP